jgi:hypothetical protein
MKRKKKTAKSERGEGGLWLIKGGVNLKIYFFKKKEKDIENILSRRIQLI